MTALAWRAATAFPALVVALATGSAICGTPAYSQSAPQLAGGEIRLSNSVIHPEDVLREVVRYSYDRIEFEKLGHDDGAGVIVHHGQPLDAVRFKRIYSHTETLPLYVGRSAGISALSPSQSRDILAGKVANWADVGGSNRQITIYGPSAEVKRQALEFQLRNAGIPLETPVRDRGSYEFLASKLTEDPGALVLGLRSREAWPERLAGARRFDPEVAPAQPMFEVPIFVYVRKESPEALAAARALLERVASRAGDDRDVYPLTDRLDQLAGE